MKKIFLTALLFCLTGFLFSQSVELKDSSLQMGKVTVFKDIRLDILARKEAEFNELYSMSPKSGKGYRLMVLSTNDRSMAMNLRAQLLQRFPEQKVYMSFQPPYIKLKFGNFPDKADAEQYKKEILRTNLVTNNIYLVPENIEIKPDKNKDKETQ